MDDPQVVRITVVEAYVITSERKRRVSMAVARQFPVEIGGHRSFCLSNDEPVPTPICKIRGETLKHPCDWLYLVQDVLSGYKWQQVDSEHPDVIRTILERGGKVDRPETVPTAIL